jgi:hypothetical protein
MTDRLPGEEEPRPDRLERWLDRKLQAGALRGLPRYRPLRGLASECPERYAQALLEGLRSSRSPFDADARERVRDDGRAFRGWVELALSPAPHGATAGAVSCSVRPV